MQKNQENLKNLTEYKLLLIGESNVGKTTIFNKYIYNKIDKNATSTIGVDFEAKNFTYKNKKYSIKLFDTAGQERFQSLTKAYYHMGEGYLIVFDLTNEYSLKAISKWIDSIKEGKDDPKFIIIGNKNDLKNQISENVINEYLKDYKHLYIKTSAIKNTNIKEAIHKIVDILDGEENNLENNEEQQENIKIINNNKQHTSNNAHANAGCC